ncbi:MAG TPA: DUF1036 domain-containing protein, partial [Candidatus Acidoferrales bacterium]|nr:DUF1036 domain-containing protein [Candidatus Acidoferrales bacterium]
MALPPTRIRLPILALAVLIWFLPSSAHAAVAEICNHGDVALNVATAIYSQSILFGNSYRVQGWYHVQPNNCETIYSSVDPDDLYVGFTYRDPKNLLHAYTSEPSDESGAIKTVSEKFCVNVEQAFDYKI